MRRCRLGSLGGRELMKLVRVRPPPLMSYRMSHQEPPTGVILGLIKGVSEMISGSLSLNSIKLNNIYGGKTRG